MASALKYWGTELLPGLIWESARDRKDRIRKPRAKSNGYRFNKEETL
jgi:hypothetical protein